MNLLDYTVPVDTYNALSWPVTRLDCYPRRSIPDFRVRLEGRVLEFPNTKLNSHAVIDCDGYRFAESHFGRKPFQDLDGLQQDLATLARNFRFDLCNGSLVIVVLELASTGFRVQRPYAFQQNAVRNFLIVLRRQQSVC